MMTRLFAFAKPAALLGAALALSSCGGLANALGGTSFQGTWSGTVNGNGLTGSMNLNIDQNNNVTGTDTISKPNTVTNDTGSISSNGNLTLVTSFGGVNVANITAAVIVVSNNMQSTSGTISILGGGSTNFSMSLNGSAFNLHKQ